MNIFAPSPCPVESARQLADRHVVKMALETAQVLSTVLSAHGLTAPYKPTHARHPCTLWAGSCRAAFDWTVAHGLALCDEYARRYGRVHGSRAAIEAARDSGVALPPGDLPPFALAMPDEHRGPDPHAAYRSYLAAKYTAWGNGARWTNAERPAWTIGAALTPKATSP